MNNPGATHAQTPPSRLINFQASIDRADQVSTNAIFRLFDSDTGGTMLWDEVHSSFEVRNKQIQVLLGSTNTLPDSIFNRNSNLYLEMNLFGEDFSPRYQLTSVPFAMHSRSSSESLDMPRVNDV